MMHLWQIVVYVEECRIPSERPKVPFMAWYAEQDSRVRATCDATLTTLMGIADWDDPDVEEFKSLTGADAGLGEVRFEVIQQEGKKQRKRQLRCLGIWPADGHEFVLLNGLEKSGRTSVPTNAYAQAHRLNKQYGQGRGRVDELFKPSLE
jgi:hypothetical protein